MSELSIIIPAFNRVELLAATCENLASSLVGIDAEVIIVDDGSAPALDPYLPSFRQLPAFQLVRQTNAGSTAARLAGLARASGTYITFLDSDDRVRAEKYHLQLAALKNTRAGLAYSDEASVRIEADGSQTILSRRTLPVTPSPLAFLLRIHAYAHNPVFERTWLQTCLGSPPIPLDPLYRPIGDTWVYYNLAYQPRPVVKVSGDLALAVQHAGERYSSRWELTGLASCALMSRFAFSPPLPPHRDEALRLIAENAVCTARALPPDAPGPWLSQVESLTSIASLSPREVGGPGFALLARFLGLKLAIRLLRRRQRPRFNTVRSDVTDTELVAAVAAMQRLVALPAPSKPLIDNPRPHVS